MASSTVTRFFVCFGGGKVEEGGGNMRVLKATSTQTGKKLLQSSYENDKAHGLLETTIDMSCLFYNEHPPVATLFSTLLISVSTSSSRPPCDFRLPITELLPSISKYCLSQHHFFHQLSTIFAIQLFCVVTFLLK